MRRPDENIEAVPLIKPTPTAELKSPPEAVVAPEPYWTEAKVLRWGSTALTVVLAIPFLWKLSNAFDGSWSWSWVPWLAVFGPMLIFSSYTWRQFLEAEEAAKKAARDAKQTALRIQVNKPQGGENQAWS